MLPATRAGLSSLEAELLLITYNRYRLGDQLKTRPLRTESALPVLGDLDTDTWVHKVSARPQTASGLHVGIDLCSL